MKNQYTISYKLHLVQTNSGPAVILGKKTYQDPTDLWSALTRLLTIHQPRVLTLPVPRETLDRYLHRGGQIRRYTPVTRGRSAKRKMTIEELMASLDISLPEIPMEAVLESSSATKEETDV